MDIDRRFLGWGAFFILVGAIPLAVRTGILDETGVGRWPSLWPLLLIGWGVGLLLRRTPVEWIGGAVTALTFGLMGGGALATGFALPGCSGDDPGAAFETQRGAVLGTGQLNIEFNCGALSVDAVPGTEWSVSGTESRARAPRVDTQGSTVTIEGPAGGGFFEDAGEARWTVGVPTTPTVGLGIALNASDGSANLSGASLSSVNVSVNAGSLELDLLRAARLGDVNATVNAGGASLWLPAGDRSVNLSLNAGSIDVCIPAGSAIRVRWSGTLASSDLDAAGLTEVGDDTWVSAGFDETQPHLEMHVSANAGSFGLDLRGTCAR